MDNVSNDYQARVAALSSDRREILAARIRAHLAAARGGTQQLVAYIENRGHESATPSLLAEFCAARLPDYMVPRRFIMTPALPRLANGKIERAGLSELHARAAATAANESPHPPLDELESTLAQIWKDVLGLDELGRDDDFFEVGGDSLLSIRILARANRAGLTISPEAFFAQPTVAAQAAAVRNSAAAPTTEPVPAAPPSDEPFPLARLDADELDIVSRTLAALDDLDED